MIQQLISQRGPLPIVTSFDYDGDGSVGLYVDGSAWTTSGSRKVGVTVEIDGQPVANVWVFSNEANSHKALMPKLVSLELSRGTHKLALVPMAGTTGDANDYYVVQIID